MEKDDYQCAQCGKVYKYEWSDEEAKEEFFKKFKGKKLEDAAVICDDCYKKLEDRIKRKMN